LNAYNLSKNSEYKYSADTCKYIGSFRSDLKRYYYLPKFKVAARALCTQLDTEEKVKEAVDKYVHEDSAYKDSLVEIIMEEGRGQDKTPSEEGQELIRRLFNELVKEDKWIDISDPTKYGDESTDKRKTDKIRDDIFKKAKFVHVRLTGGKGQGLNISFENDLNIYLSVGNSGKKVIFPNDGVQLSHKGERIKDIIKGSDAKEVQKVLGSFDSEKDKLFRSIDDCFADYLPPMFNTAGVIRPVLEEMAAEGVIKYDWKYSTIKNLRFRTDNMNRIFPEVDSKISGWSNTHTKFKHNTMYEVVNDKDNNSIHLRATVCVNYNNFVKLANSEEQEELHRKQKRYGITKRVKDNKKQTIDVNEICSISTENLSDKEIAINVKKMVIEGLAAFDTGL